MEMTTLILMMRTVSKKVKVKLRHLAGVQSCSLCSVREHGKAGEGGRGSRGTSDLSVEATCIGRTPFG